MNSSAERLKGHAPRVKGYRGGANGNLHLCASTWRNEPGCLGINAFRSIRDGRLFYIHSKWREEEAFEIHARLPHTVRFREPMETCIDHALEVTRTERNG